MDLFYIFFGSLISINFTVADDEKCSTEEEKIMFFFAGFMTAALAFSLGCCVSKCKSESSNKIMDQDDREQTQQQQTLENLQNASPATRVYTNEGIAVSYANINTEASNMEEYSTSSRPMMSVTESYDTVEHKRVSSVLNTAIDNNPYNRSVQHTDNTGYDVACLFKSTVRTDDPTYSHASPAETRNPEDQNNYGHKLSVTQSTSSNSNKQNKTMSSKMTAKWTKSSKRTTPNTQLTKNGLKINICDGTNNKMDHTFPETRFMDTLYENSTEQWHAENFIGNDDENSSTSSEFLFGQDNDSSQYVTSCGESSQMSSEQSDEDSCLVDNDIPSDQTGSEIDSTFPTIMAVNALYEDFDVPNNNLVLGSQNDLSARLERET